MNVLDDKLNGDAIFSAPRHDDVGVYHWRSNVITVRGFHHLHVLFQNTIQVSTPLRNVSVIKC